MAGEYETNWNEVLENAKAGVKEARERLFGEIKVRLFLHFPRYIVKGWFREELEELVQETSMFVLENLSEVKTNVFGYAYTVFKYKRGDADRKRRRDRERKIGIEGMNPWDRDRILTRLPTILEEIESAELVDFIVEAVKEMSAFCQFFFRAKLQEWTPGEIWKEIRTLDPDMKRNNFDKRTHDCRRALKKRFKSLHEKAGR